jgi:L-alanine-DL-glutamate epimerase-like enolase superfamily enzyme
MMEIAFTGIGVWRAVFPLRLRFSHHLASRHRAETLILTLKTSRGGLGHGQALPRPYLTGESLDSVLAAIQDRLWPALRKIPLPAAGGWLGALETLRPLHAQAETEKALAAYSALDVAALDAFAAALGLPLPALPGFPAAPERKPETPLVGVIPAMKPTAAAWLTRLLRLLGYRRFKVKLDRDWEGNALRLGAVRRAAGSGAWLAVDANCAWSREEALSQRDLLVRQDVSLVEEPLNRELAAKTDFAVLEKELGLPVMADESLCALADAHSLLSRGSPSWWNLRLAKIGGFSGWAALSRLAAEEGKKVYGGILVGETSLLAAAAGAAWSGGGALCGECGFPRLFLAGDPFRGGPGGFRGSFRPAAGKRGPGLGVSLDPARLESVAEPLWRDGDYERG